MIKQRKNMEYEKDKGQGDLSQEMLNFLASEERESRVQALIDAARETGLTNYSREDALRDLTLQKNNLTPSNNE